MIQQPRPWFRMILVTAAVPVAPYLAAVTNVMLECGASAVATEIAALFLGLVVLGAMVAGCAVGTAATGLWRGRVPLGWWSAGCAVAALGSAAWIAVSFMHGAHNPSTCRVEL